MPQLQDSSLLSGVETLSKWIEPRHALLLRMLLDSSDNGIQLQGSSAGLERIHRVLDEMRRDTRIAFFEFRKKWDPRLDMGALIPLLERNQWILANPMGGVTLPGKGTRKEVRLLYLQILHDMVSDCGRQWASLSGRLQGIQTALVADWHREALSENGTRVLPTLEAAIRTAEFDTWKSLRLSLGEMAEEIFVRTVGRWAGRQFADAQSLILDIVKPWESWHASGNGFIGFTQVFSSLVEEMAMAMMNHYDQKWELLFRGFNQPIGKSH